jgi:hypothetical protein
VNIALKLRKGCGMPRRHVRQVNTLCEAGASGSRSADFFMLLYKFRSLDVLGKPTGIPAGGLYLRRKGKSLERLQKQQ